MDVISLDDTADSSSLFIIDDKPITEDESPTNVTGRKRKSGGKNNNWKKFKKNNQQVNGSPKKSYRVLGGVVTGMPERKKKPVETIVIDDEESVIELSDDDDNDSGLSNSIQMVQDELRHYQFLPCSNPLRRRPKRNFGKKRPEQSTAVARGEDNEERTKVVPFPHTTNCPKAPEPQLVQPEAPPVKRKLRPVVIDGSNVAFGHGDSRKQFSSKGIKICADFFIKRGHTVKVFIPQFRRRHPATLDTHILDELEEKKIVVYTPSRHVDGKRVVSYDDRMILEYAMKSGAVIVTRDNFRDLAAESELFKKLVYERILMFTWVDDEEVMFPQDPLGRHGPTLDEFLAFSDPEETDNTSTTNQENKEDNKQEEKNPS